MKRERVRDEGNTTNLTVHQRHRENREGKKPKRHHLSETLVIPRGLKKRQHIKKQRD